MPSVAVPTVAAPTVAAPASSGSSASGATARTRDRDAARDSRADFQTEVDSALRDDASPTSVASERSTSERDTTQDTRETGRTDERRPARDTTGDVERSGRGGEPAVDRDTMAAMIAAGEAGDVAPPATTPPQTAAPGEATAYENLLAQLGLKLDANGQVVLAGGDAATDGSETTTDGVATDLAAALAALAQLLGQQQPAQPTTTTVPQTGTTTTGATAAGTAPTLPVPGLATGDGAEVPSDLAAATDPTALAAAAEAGEAMTGQAAVDTSARPMSRTGVTATKAEERLRRISAEVAKLDGGATNGALAGVEVKGTVTPVTALSDDAVATVPAATLGELLAIAERGAGADPLPQAPAKAAEPTTPFMLPTALSTDPAAGTVATAQTPTSIPSSQATLDTLAQTVAAHAARQDSRFEIKLNPHELGKVDVTMHISSDGTVTAHLRVERPETLDMMLRDQSHLQRALEQSGLNVGSGGLEFSLQQQGQGWDRDAAEPVREVAEEEVEDGAAVEAVAAARRYSRAGPAGIDLRI